MLGAVSLGEAIMRQDASHLTPTIMTAVVSKHLVTEAGNCPPQLSSDLRISVATLVQESISTTADEHLLFLHDHALQI